MWTGDNLHIMRGMNSETVDHNYSAPIGSEAAGQIDLPYGGLKRRERQTK